MSPRSISWGNIVVDILYFAFLWWVIPTHPTVMICILAFLLLTQSWLLFINTIPVEMAYKALKDRYTTFWFLGACFVLRGITVIPFFFYGEYIMAALQALVMGTFWWVYQRTIRTGKRMGLR